MSKKNDTPFNNPFGPLKALKKDEPKREPKSNVVAKSVQPLVKKPSTDEEDAALFFESVGEVAQAKQRVDRVGPTAPRSVGELRIAAEEAESLAHLVDLVASESEFDFSDSDDFIEGSVTGFDTRVMRKLRNGDFVSQASVDLHGLVRDDAKSTLEAFLQKSRLAGHRCVLVITGKGLHSKDAIPVIKQSVQMWLTRGKVAHHVLAFCSANARDGGTGAVYVLLRRER